MTKRQKLEVIKTLIETGREADKLINACAAAIGELLKDEYFSDWSKDYMFVAPGDPTPKQAAQILIEESEAA